LSGIDWRKSKHEFVNELQYRTSSDVNKVSEDNGTKSESINEHAPAIDNVCKFDKVEIDRIASPVTLGWQPITSNDRNNDNLLNERYPSFDGAMFQEPR
jgi:hypothetical protein